MLSNAPYSIPPTAFPFPVRQRTGAETAVQLSNLQCFVQVGRGKDAKIHIEDNTGTYIVHVQ